MPFKTKDLIVKIGSFEGRRLMACEGETCGDSSEGAAETVCQNGSACLDTAPCGPTCAQTHQTNVENVPGCQGSGCPAVSECNETDACPDTSKVNRPDRNDLRELRQALSAQLKGIDSGTGKSYGNAAGI